MSRPIIVAAAIAAIATAGAALALDITAQIKARQDYFHGIGGAMKGLNDELKKPAPAKDQLAHFAAILDSEAPKLPGLFPAGTGLDSGQKTGAKPDIWLKPDEFKKDAQDFASAAHAVNAAAAGSDTVAFQAATAHLGDTCRSCHQTFRQSDH